MIFILMMILMDPDELRMAERNFYIALLTLIVLFLTLVVVGIYTCYTKKIQKAMTKQIEEMTHQIRLSIMPAFLAEIARIKIDSSQPEFDGVGDYGDRIHITNIGYGPAINLEIDPVYIHERGTTDRPLNIVFERLAFLRPSERRPINQTSREGEDKAGVNLLIGFEEKYSRRVHQLNIRFQDIEGSQYTQKVEMGKGGCKLGPVILVSEKHQCASNGV